MWDSRGRLSHTFVVSKGVAVADLTASSLLAIIRRSFSEIDAVDLRKSGSGGSWT
jgi:hypothetical protein